jgi:serine/threonine protein kinase
LPDVLKTVGRYEILREVGRGGMAVVYLARQTDLDRFVALKELAAFHAADHSLAQRFLRESRVAGSLSHPNIVTVHDYFEHDGTPYIAMEYVERGSLRPYVGRLTPAQIGGVLEGLLAALAHAEQHGIVHRDLKPENLMVTSDGRVKIADFGIAKATTRMQTGAFLTATGTTVGTPTYMAPEQAMAQEIGPWTDLYSVGCMAFELYTGRVPFHDSEAPMAILLRHVNEPIPPVRSIDPSVDERISDWVEALLVKDPDQRTRSAADAWDELEEILISQLGPRWRREARLPLDTESIDTPKPLTPAPFVTFEPRTTIDPVAAPTPTLTPQTLPEAREPRERRSRFPLVVAGVVVVAAVAGFLIAGTGGDDSGGGEPQAAENGAIRLELPAGWSRAETLPAVPGLDGATGYTAPDGGTVMLGTTDADNAALLPAGLLEAAGGVPDQRTPVALGPDKLQAYRYSDVEVEGLDQPLTVYALPTRQGVATVACLPGSASCEGVANTLELVSGDPLPVGPSGQYAKAVSDALGTVAKADVALRRASTPRAQAAAARDLQAAYRSASQALGEQPVNPADASANARLVAALGATAKAYGQAASAAAAGSKPRYQQAGRAVNAARRDIDGALEGLRAAGYEIGS